jgi:uncharacterized membrane protein
MNRFSSSLLGHTAGLAALSGARSMMGLALLSRQLRQHPSRRLGRSRLGFMQSSRTAKVLTLLAVGELVGDKLPSAPDRISSAALTGRALSGALIGATLATRQRQARGTGISVGVVSAVVGTYATFHLRKRLGQTTGVPDPVWAVLEDVLVITLGRRLLH